MAWILVGVAGVLEVVWAYFMKTSEGFSKPLESALCIATMIASFWLLSIAMKSLPLGTAYAVWTGIGAVGAFIVGVIALGEPANALRIVSACLILGGIAGLRLSSAA
jgi:quaternary ammonium compound-resistance protein SugE